MCTHFFFGQKYMSNGYRTDQIFVLDFARVTCCCTSSTVPCQIAVALQAPPHIKPPHASSTHMSSAIMRQVLLLVKAL